MQAAKRLSPPIAFTLKVDRKLVAETYDAQTVQKSDRAAMDG